MIQLLFSKNFPRLHFGRWKKITCKLQQFSFIFKKAKKQKFKIYEWAFNYETCYLHLIQYN